VRVFNSCCRQTTWCYSSCPRKQKSYTVQNIVYMHYLYVLCMFNACSNWFLVCCESCGVRILILVSFCFRATRVWYSSQQVRVFFAYLCIYFTFVQCLFIRWKYIEGDTIHEGAYLPKFCGVECCVAFMVHWAERTAVNVEGGSSSHARGTIFFILFSPSFSSLSFSLQLLSIICVLTLSLVTLQYFPSIASGYTKLTS